MSPRRVDLDTARAMGERAGRHFLDTGIMRRCPLASNPTLAVAWYRALLETITPTIRRRLHPSTESRDG